MYKRIVSSQDNNPTFDVCQFDANLRGSSPNSVLNPNMSSRASTKYIRDNKLSNSFSSRLNIKLLRSLLRQH